MRARQEAQLAINFYRSRAKSDLNNHRARLSWAEGLAMQEDFAGAVAVLQEGLTATGEAVYRAAIAMAYRGWHDERKRARDSTPGELYELLHKGLSYDPTNKDLLNRLLDGLGKPGKESDQARAALEKLLASGKATAFAHFALSVDALHRNQQADARFHLERAHEIDPRLAVVANNLAWTLCQPPNPDLDRALRLAILAVEQEPNNPAFRDTRGNVYLKLGREREAIADLEAALARTPESPPLHLALAQAYDKLGNASLAAEHRRLARAVSTRP